MEQTLEKILEDKVNTTGNIIGCVLADRSGLCLEARGNVTRDSAAIIAAIADQAGRIESKSPLPIIRLQNENRQCLIQCQGPVIGAIFKTASLT